MGEGNNLVGVDIGSSSIKVCQVKETRKGLVLQRLGYAPLPPQTIVDGQVMDAATVVETLKRVFSEAKIRNRNVALSVSGQSVIIRKISVPMMTPAELAEQITWEAEQHIPFDIKDVQVDYQVLRKRPEASQMDLLLVAAKKDQIKEYAQLAREAKLKPVIVDIDAFTLQNSFSQAHAAVQGQTVALINVGATLSSLNIVSGGVSAFTREIANGGNVITDEIARQLSVPFQVAEGYKCGTAPEGGFIPPQVAGIVEQVLDSIAAEIQRSLDFFMATSGEGDIAKIYLTGGTANLPSLATAIERRARVGVEVWFPTQHVMVEKGVDTAMLQARSAQLPVALGLSLRRDKESRGDTSLVRVNLIPSTKSGGSSSTEKGQGWLIAVMVLLAIEVIGALIFYSFKQEELDGLKRESSNLQGQIKLSQEKVQDHPAVKKKLEVLREREDAIAKLQSARSGPTAVVLEIARLMTPGRGPSVTPEELAKVQSDNPLAMYNASWDSRRLWLTDFVEEARTVKLRGIARDGEDVSELARRMNLSAYFFDVKLLPAKRQTQ
ncbi:MAG: pilus assembly protein PilM, partial [Pseudomonadota bacterium]